MGDQADDILMSFKLSSEEIKNYDTIVKKFDSHFVPQHNVIFERAKLNQRKQQTGETVNSFITDLYCLSEQCKYSDLKDEMIRDRIVVGLLDRKLSVSEKLQLDEKLTLHKAVEQCRQSETFKKQQSELFSEDHANVDAVKQKSKTNNSTYHKQRPQNRNFKPKQSNESRRCGRCGRFRIDAQKGRLPRERCKVLQMPESRTFCRPV